MADYSTPLKKAQRSLSGAATYKTWFKKDWKKLYPGAELENLLVEFCCNICPWVVSCSHQGQTDVKRHVKEPIHQKKWKGLKSMKKLHNFGFRKQDNTLREQVIYEFLQPRLYGTVCKSVTHIHTHTYMHMHTHTNNKLKLSK